MTYPLPHSSVRATGSRSALLLACEGAGSGAVQLT